MDNENNWIRHRPSSSLVGLPISDRAWAEENFACAVEMEAQAFATSDRLHRDDLLHHAAWCLETALWWFALAERTAPSRS